MCRLEATLSSVISPDRQTATATFLTYSWENMLLQTLAKHTQAHAYLVFVQRTYGVDVLQLSEVNPVGPGHDILRKC